MIKGLLNALVSHPAVYSLCQHTIGAGRVTQRIARYVPSGYSRVLDIGSGSGYAGRMWPAEADYIPLDIDRAMLHAGQRPLAVQSEATELPLIDSSMDMVLCKQVSHHIPEDRLDHLFAEIQRVLRPDGRLLFMDAVRTDRAVSNLLWRYDRGSHPRPEDELRRHLERRFELLQREAHWHLHLYVLYLLAPAAPSELEAVTRPDAAVLGQT
jgi:SAM-dependent methyltransferase